MVNIIRVNNIIKNYQKGSKQEVVALNGIDLNVAKGDMVAIMGPSGSGKSTLLHILGGLETFDSGSYYLDNINIGKLKQNQLAKLRGEKIGFVLQEHGLLEDRTIWENVAIPLMVKMRRIRKVREVAIEMIDRFGIKDLAYMLPTKISVGQKQRVAIARAIVNNPDIILCDEPTGSLDSENSGNVMEALMELNKTGKTIIIVTHDSSIANQCEKILVLKDGEF